MNKQHQKDPQVEKAVIRELIVDHLRQREIEDAIKHVASTGRVFSRGDFWGASPYESHFLAVNIRVSDADGKFGSIELSARSWATLNAAQPQQRLDVLTHIWRNGVGFAGGKADAAPIVEYEIPCQDSVKVNPFIAWHSVQVLGLEE